MHEPVNQSVSDHYIVQMNMILYDTEIGPGYWKCNSKIKKKRYEKTKKVSVLM